MNGRKITTGRVLIVEGDEPIAMLYADLIRTHCPGLRIDCCHPSQQTLIEDNAGGADVAILSCGPTPATALDALRMLQSVRSCITTLVLIPADRPELADIAIASGATDVLLKAPGYLEQIAAAARKNVVVSRSRTAERTRMALAFRWLEEARAQIADLRRELAVASLPIHVNPSPNFGPIRIGRPVSREQPARIELRSDATAQAA